MESFVAAQEGARKRLSAAEHILTQSYPLIKDPKLLVAVLKNLNEAVDEMVEALAAYESSRKRISTIPESTDARLSLLRQKVPKGFLKLVNELHETMNEHKKSPVEFTRKEAFVICDESYRIRTLTQEQLRRHLQQAKTFFRFIEEKVNRNDAIVARRA